MKRILKITGCIVLTGVVIIGVFILIAVITDYKPDPETPVFKTKEPFILPDTITIRMISWNTGYCGLDKHMDFFYDGGSRVRPEKEKIRENLDAVIRFLNLQQETDLFLLQEVDKKSKRSYRINQYDSIAKHPGDRHAVFGKNYDVFYVPLPLTKPMGKTLSGLMTTGTYTPRKVVRHSFDGNYPFPTGLFMPDRCFLVNRYELTSGKELLVINTHNSAYDDGNLRIQQMIQLKDFIMNEYDKGNYVITGGDWNQCPPGLQHEITGRVFDTLNFVRIENDFLPGEWTWVYSNDVPTNRRVKTAYDKDKTPVTVIDFFLVSPNVEVVLTENIDLGFEHSDHNPVRAVFQMKLPDRK